MRTRALVAASVLGIAAAAATVGNGGYLLADQDVEPFRIDIAVVRARIRRGPQGSGLPDGVRTLGSLVSELVLGLVVALLFFLVATALWQVVAGLLRLRRVRMVGPPTALPSEHDAGEASDDDLVAALRDRLRGALTLDAGAEEGAGADDVVIACWLAMLAAAADAGTARAVHETPRETLARVLAAHAVPADALDRLAALYERARFSPHPVDAAMRSQARAALGEVLIALDAAALLPEGAR